MNFRRQKLVDVVRELIQAETCFGVYDVLEKLDTSESATYVGNRLYELSCGSFPILRCVSSSSMTYTEREYIGATLRLASRTPKVKGMNKETFHALYGCFGVSEVVKDGRYIYNKAAANLARKIIEVYILHQRPELRELIGLLKSIKARHPQLTNQSIQIGIVHALQNRGYAPEAIPSILASVFKKWPAKTSGRAPRELRANAAQLRHSLSK